MRRRKGLTIVVVLSCVLALLLAVAVVPAAAQTAPPFRAGEVVVAGAPESIPAGFTVLKHLPNAGLTVLAVESGREWGAVQRLRAEGRRAGLNLVATATLLPNDALLGYQWHFTAVQAPAAWDLTTGAGAVVAVLDTGLAPGGPDGIGCTVPGYDAVNLDADPFDGNGHGTHVAGTVAQATNNLTGVAGLAHGACVMPVKVLDDAGSGSFADIAEGIHWAVNHGAQVINMSLATNARYRVSSDPLVDPALELAEAAGVTVVCAAGNDGSRTSVSYPAIYPTAIAVGATDLANAVTAYSNKGLGLDLVAPGGDTSKDLNADGYPDGVLQETRYGGSWGYWFFSGTSMAAPHVAAAAALLRAAGTATTPDAVRTALTATALDIGDPGFDKSAGHGLLQVRSALEYAPAPPPGTLTDADGDGHYLEVDDCDDANRDVYPGHQDTKGRWGRDGVDNDCDGLIDG